MPVIYQKIIKRDDLRRNPKILYVFGDNCERVGLGGQAGEMRGEPNAIGVATLYGLGRPFNGSEIEIDIVNLDMEPLFTHVGLRGTVILPSDGIGTGIADLKTNAPATLAHIEARMATLCGYGSEVNE